MPTSTIPMHQFDLMAGGKACYEEFQIRMGAKEAVPWQKLTLEYQERWKAIARAGIQAAKDTRQAKQQRVT